MNTIYNYIQDKDVIRRIKNGNFNEIRLCYR